MSEDSILFINVVCLLLVLAMFAVLTLATRMKGAAGFAALVVFIGTMPVHAFNMCRSLGYFDWAAVFYFFSPVNTLLMPLIYLFVRRQLDFTFPSCPKIWIHFILYFINLAICFIVFPWNEADYVEWFRKQNDGMESWPFLVNDVSVLVQMLVYYPLSLRYVRKVRRQLLENFSDNDLLHIRWLEHFLWVSLGLLVFVMVAYAINPRTDAWLIPILNAVLAIYMLYESVANPTQEFAEKYRLMVLSLKEKKETRYSASRLSEEEMAENCRKIVENLRNSTMYLNPSYSVRQLSEQTQISQAYISQSLNLYLKRTFFELINDLRVEHAKEMMCSASRNNYTIEGIASSCGFRSRSTFYSAFKRVENSTPAEWMRTQKITLVEEM